MYVCAGVPSESQEKLEKICMRWGANICTIITESRLRLAQRCMARLVALKATRQTHYCAIGIRVIANASATPSNLTCEPMAGRAQNEIASRPPNTPRRGHAILLNRSLGWVAECPGEIVLRSPQANGCAGLECLNRFSCPAMRTVTLVLPCCSFLKIPELPSVGRFTISCTHCDEYSLYRWRSLDCRSAMISHLLSTAI